MARLLAGAKGSLVGTDLLRPRALRAPSPRVELPVPRVERAEPRLQDGKDTSMCEPMSDTFMQGGAVVAPIHQLATPYDIVPGRPWPEHLVSMLNPARNTP